VPEINHHDRMMRNRQLDKADPINQRIESRRLSIDRQDWGLHERGERMREVTGVCDQPVGDQTLLGYYII
jgi:hypothetical protein